MGATADAVSRVSPIPSPLVPTEAEVGGGVMPELFRDQSYQPHCHGEHTLVMAEQEEVEVTGSSVTAWQAMAATVLPAAMEVPLQDLSPPLETEAEAAMAATE